MTTKPKRLPRAAVDTFRNDPMFPRVERVVAALLAKGKVVTPVGVLVGMGLLTAERLADWRFGRVAYLTRVINCNLTRLSRLLRVLRFHAHDLNLVPSATAYMRHGKGPKQRLRFSKTGDPGLEKAYATHFIWPGKLPFYDPRRKQMSGSAGATAGDDNAQAAHGGDHNAGRNGQLDFSG